MKTYKKKSRSSRFTGFLLAMSLALLAGLFLFPFTVSAGDIKTPNVTVTQNGSVNWNTTYQRIDGFGASCAFSDRTWSPNTADTFFSANNVETNICIGLSLLRNSITTNVTATASEIGLMQLAQARGVRIWSAPWTPPPAYKDNTNEVGGDFVSANYSAYASRLADYVVTMKNTYNVNIYALSIQNEPDAIVGYVSCYWSPQQFHDFVPHLRDALVASNVASTKIMLPEDEFWKTDYYVTAMSDPAVAANVDIIGNHNYWDAGYPAAPLPLYRNTNAAVWETEVSTFDAPDGSIVNGMMWAVSIYDFLTVAQVNAWHYWWLISGNPDNEGLELQGDIPTKRMYVVGQFSRFVRPSYERIGVNAGGSRLLATAFKDTSSPNFAIIAINNNTGIDVSQTFNLNNFPPVDVMTPWMTSSSNSLAEMPAVTVSGSSFTYTIPAQSVVTFVGQGNTPLDITPPNGFEAVSRANGTFDVSSQDFSLTNTGATSLDWFLVNTSSWLNASPESGTLPVGGQTDVTVSLNPVAYYLEPGNRAATICFTNAIDGFGQSRQFDLLVEPLVLNGGFELGDFSDWTLNAMVGYINVISNGVSLPPHSGSYMVALGQPFGLGSLSQTLPTVAGQTYLLSLWLESTTNSNSPYQTQPNEFRVNWGGEKIFDQSDVGIMGWTNLQFIVTAATTNTVLQFASKDMPWYLSLDDVQVIPISVPTVHSCCQSNGTMRLGWTAVSGLQYQLECKTNLFQPNWTEVGSVVTATNSTMIVPDIVGPDPQRFYRIRWIPPY